VNYLVTVLLIIVGIGLMVVGGLQLYMAVVATMVGTQPFEMSNGELAEMGAVLLPMGIGFEVLALLLPE
jgi:TRAP-type C4-dicarboxylate transport system permease small subunit